MSTNSSGFIPVEMVNALHGELLRLQGERRTGSVNVSFWVVKGSPREVQIRGGDTLHVVALSS